MREYAQSYSHTLKNISDRHFIFFQVQCLQISLHNDDNEMVLCKTTEYDLQAETYLTIWTHKLHNNNENKLPDFPECIRNKWQNMMEQTSQAHNHGQNMIIMGKIDTSDSMMIITWAIVSFQSPKLKWASWRQTTLYIVMTIKGNW